MRGDFDLNQAQTKLNVYSQDVDLVKMYQKGDTYVFENILKLFAPMIKYYSKKYYAPGLQYDDLWQEGCIGLLQAINKYKIDGGSMFRSYAKVNIQSHIINAVKKAKRKKHELFNKSLSLFQSCREEKGFNIIDLIPANSPTPEEIIMEQFEDLYNQRILLVFTDIEKKVLKHYLNGFSYNEVAGVVGINYKSVDNALKRIKIKLKKMRRY